MLTIEELNSFLPTSDELENDVRKVQHTFRDEPSAEEKLRHLRKIAADSLALNPGEIAVELLPLTVWEDGSLFVDGAPVQRVLRRLSEEQPEHFRTPRSARVQAARATHADMQVQEVSNAR
jgi:hypothetical protein